VFKIRRKSDGLFSTGGYSPRFSKQGKVWSLRNHVSSHLSQFGKKLWDTYFDCEVIEFECVPKNTIGVSDFYQKTLDRKEKEQKEREVQRKRDRMNYLRDSIADQTKQLQELSKSDQ
jgi:hypothetical protein